MDTQMQKIMDNQMQTGFIGFQGFVLKAKIFRVVDVV